jgi:FAD/FMN-containing dehydrogenase
MYRPIHNLESWGRRRSHDAAVHSSDWITSDLPAMAGPILPHGLGRSYGDSCLVNRGLHVTTTRLDRFIAFDPERGVLRCEAGCSLLQLLEFLVPMGWFVPVTPGTKFVTVGGCVANDVHGKNHHRAGSFGRFVTALGLRRSDGLLYECSLAQHADYFKATIGGLGLTGLIVWVELQLKPISSSMIKQKVFSLEGWDDFFRVAAREDDRYEYSVAWLDTSHVKKPRGLFLAGNHVEKGGELSMSSLAPRLSLPLSLPNFALGAWSLNWMNRFYYTASRLGSSEKTIFFDSFFYPLDSVANWNRAYGKKGLAQYQFVVPFRWGVQALSECMEKIWKSGQRSFLTVVKTFGTLRSPGMLSFPREGATVCFDFPFLGEDTLKLLDELDRTVFRCEGALYPAKDFRMSQDSFESSFPEHESFRKWMDPVFASNFSKRVGLTR